MYSCHFQVASRFSSFWAKVRVRCFFFEDMTLTLKTMQLVKYYKVTQHKIKLYKKKTIFDADFHTNLRFTKMNVTCNQNSNNVQETGGCYLTNTIIWRQHKNFTSFPIPINFTPEDADPSCRWYVKKKIYKRRLNNRSYNDEEGWETYTTYRATQLIRPRDSSISWLTSWLRENNASAKCFEIELQILVNYVGIKVHKMEKVFG